MQATPPLPPAGNRPIMPALIQKAGWTPGQHPRGYHGRWITVYHGSREGVPSDVLRQGLKLKDGEAWVSTSASDAARFGPPVELRLRDEGIYPDTHPLVMGAYSVARKRPGKNVVHARTFNDELRRRGVKAVAEVHAQGTHYRILDPSIVEAPVQKAGWSEAAHPRAAGGRFGSKGQAARHRKPKRKKRKHLSKIHVRQEGIPLPAPIRLKPKLSAEQQAWVNSVTSDPELRKYLACALAYWGGRIPPLTSVEWGDLSMFKDAEAGGLAPGGVTYRTSDGYAVDKIVISFEERDATPEDLAIIMSHEFGHSLGYNHSDVGTFPIMNGGFGLYPSVEPVYPYYRNLPPNSLVDSNTSEPA